MTSKKVPSEYLRLKESHSTFNKFLQLIDLADKLGLRFSTYYNRMILSDTDQKNVEFLVQDIESQNSPSEFPPGCEFIILMNNPDRITFDKAIEEEQRKQDRVKQELIAKQVEVEAQLKRKRQEERIKEEAEEKEKQERELLVALKAKYEV